jgi:hypothetical protein
MINVTLKVLGDPDYIKQDEVFGGTLADLNIATVPSADPRLLPGNGSLTMDAGALYVQVLFRTPIDIDESTGFMKFDSNYQHSVFSGLYMVNRVHSSFRDGKFTQELYLIRQPRQTAFDYVNGQNNKSTNRQPMTPQAQVGIQPPAPVPSLLVSGGGAPPSAASQADLGNQVPGQAAVTANNDTATVGPNFSGGYYGDQVDASGGGYDPTQQDLMAVNDSAPSATITEQTAPDYTPISIPGNKVPGQAAITG